MLNKINDESIRKRKTTVREYETHKEELGDISIIEEIDRDSTDHDIF